MTDGRGRFDDTGLARLLVAGRASGDPATLERALTRLAATTREPAWLAWLTRPGAVAAAAAMLVVSVGAGIWYGGGLSTGATTAAYGSSANPSDLLGALLADAPDATTGVAGDSGWVR